MSVVVEWDTTHEYRFAVIAAILSVGVCYAEFIESVTLV